jgi:hypothetical protein
MKINSRIKIIIGCLICVVLPAYIWTFVSNNPGSGIRTGINAYLGQVPANLISTMAIIALLIVMAAMILGIKISSKIPGEVRSENKK